MILLLSATLEQGASQFQFKASNGPGIGVIWNRFGLLVVVMMKVPVESNHACASKVCMVFNAWQFSHTVTVGISKGRLACCKDSHSSVHCLCLHELCHCHFLVLARAAHDVLLLPKGIVNGLRLPQ
jgi:hypothetical protein